MKKFVTMLTYVTLLTAGPEVYFIGAHSNMSTC